ncbi:MAG: hypothetical protein IJN91_01980 [Alphaproteobacteria bacterium]|nr:hypothetical protein [Alphaproteobacteria bacterium]
MKKILISAVFGFGMIITANASIISRGFFDEAIAKYALKSDVGDVSSLQSKIGDFTGYNVPENMWDNIYTADLREPGLGAFLTGRDWQAPTTISDAISVLLGSPDDVADGVLNKAFSTVAGRLRDLEISRFGNKLPSTSEDGQYVLTAKKVGNNITYTWVKMDLTSEEQSQ